MIELILPQKGSLLDTHTETQNKFIRMIKEKGIDEALEWLLPVKDDEECSHPLKIKFEWKCDDAQEYTFELSESCDFALAETIKTKENFLYVTNLKISQKYFWRVNCCEPSFFETLDNEYRFKVDHCKIVKKEQRRPKSRLCSNFLPFQF